MRNPGRGAFGDRLLSGATPYPIFATDTFTGEVNLNLRDGHQIQDARQVMCLKEVGKYEANAPGWSSLRANALRSYASRADAFIIGRGPDGYPITSLDVPNAAELGRNRALTHARHRFNPDHRRAHSLAQSEGGSRTRNVLAAEDWPQQATAAHAAVLDQVNYARSVSSRAYPDQWPATTSMLASSSRPSSSPLAAGTRIERAQTPPVSPLALSAIVSSPLGDSQKVLSKASSPLPVSQSTKHRKRRPQVAPAPYADRI
jgi:hypothetical protein